MKTTMIAAAAAATTLTLAPMQASALMTLMIDDFTTPHWVTAQPIAGVPSASQIVAPGAIGGFRSMRVETDLAEPSVSSLRIFSGTPSLAFSNDAATTSRGWIVYDGANDSSTGNIDKTGLGGVNFLIGPDPFFDFNIITADPGLFVRISVWDMNETKTQYTEILPAVDLDPLLPLTDFSVVELGLGGETVFDWTRVGAIEFFVEATLAAYDGQIGAITVNAIPLPAPALLLLGGLGGLGGMTLLRNRRRKA